jgi:hypothetical protein
MASEEDNVKAVAIDAEHHGTDKTSFRVEG